MVSRQKHWDKVYLGGETTSLGWYQPKPDVSLRLIAEAGIKPNQRVIDVGGGASLLVDHLLERGFSDLTVADLSQSALSECQMRMGDRATRIQWICRDITTLEPEHAFDLWHDRAVLHFLTRKNDRHRYRQAMLSSLAPGGIAIIATFALGGRRRCAGLWVRRYGEDDIQSLFGDELRLERTVSELHVTPNGIEQPYTYFVLRRRGGADKRLVSGTAERKGP